MDIARRRIDNSRSDVDYFRNQSLPKVDLNFSFWSPGISGVRYVYQDDNPLSGVVIGRIAGGRGESFSDILKGKYPNWSVTLTLEVPIASFLSRTGLARARAAGEQNELRLEKEKSDIEFEVQDVVRELEAKARMIASRRRMTKIESTVQLRTIVEEVCRWIPQKGKTHPAAKVFQALRIEVNEELAGLGEFLESVIARLPEDGRLAVISFHSLEDRIVKHTFLQAARPDQETGRRPAQVELLTKHPVVPGEAEISRNSRSRSAKLRAVRKQAHGS